MNDKEKEKARDKIRMLEGRPPHNSPSNPCYGDGYFATSIERDYGMSISDLKKKVGM